MTQTETNCPATAAVVTTETSSKVETSSRVEASGRVEPTDEELERCVRGLPSQVGVVLVLAGVTGMVLPGSPGLPLVAAGGLVLSPTLFGKVDGWLKQRFPDVRRHGLRTVFRFAADLERRYPEE